MDELIIKILKNFMWGLTPSAVQLNITSKQLKEILNEMRQENLIDFQEYHNQYAPQFEGDPNNVNITEEGKAILKKYISIIDIAKHISEVIVYLDDNVPQYMDGIIRIGNVEYKFDTEKLNENCFDLPDFVDNTEFHSEDEIKQYIANFLKIAKDIISIN